MRNTAIAGARRAAGSLWFRAGASVVLLGIVFLEVDWSTAAERLDGGEWPLFVAAVGLIEVAFLVGAVRWHRLVSAARIAQPFAHSLRAYMIGMFSNNFLPTGFGGDAARALIAGRSGSRLVRVATSVVVDRVSSVLCLVLLAWIAIGADPGGVPPSIVAGLLGVTLAGAAAGAVGTLLFRRGARFAAVLPASLGRWAVEVRAVIVGYVRDASLLAWALALGLVFQAVTVAATWLLARVLGIDVPFALLAAVVPMVLIATMAPISLAGLGVREGSYIILLGTAGVTTTDAALLSLMTAAAMALASTAGAVPVILRRAEPMRAGQVTRE